MNSSFYHLQVNINKQNLSFYKNLMTFLNWTVIFQTEEMAGFGDKNNASLWFLQGKTTNPTDYDATGVNHISIRVETPAEVDETVEYLKQNNITPLFDTPKHRPEFSMAEDETYYQVMFESPDKILFEVVYAGKK